MKKTYYSTFITGIHKTRQKKLELTFMNFTDKKTLNHEVEKMNVDVMKKDYKNFKVKNTKEIFEFNH